MVLSGFLWLASSAGIFVLSWPAMWVDPQQALSLIFDYAASRAVNPEYLEVFFLGETVVGRDPGPLFYAIVILWRMSPWVLLGFLGSLVWLVSGGDGNWRSWSRTWEMVVMLAFLVLYFAGMSMGAIKHARYMLATFPIIDIVAAIGLVWVARSAVRRWLPRVSSPSTTVVGLAILLVTQLLFMAPHHPYYYTFYNPLLGGGTVAARLMRVGWGEGMDQVADYLNSKPNPDELIVATRFGKYMLGAESKIIPLDNTHQWLQADYISFYVQQVQKMIDPSPGVIRYFQRQMPEHIVQIGGIDYASIYANPIQFPADPRASTIDGQATLFGYSWNYDDSVAQAKLVWQNDGLDTNTLIRARLVQDATGQVGSWQPCETAPGNEPQLQSSGEIIESLCLLSPGDIAPGPAGVEFALEDNQGHITAFEFPLARTTFLIDAAGRIQPFTEEESFEAVVQSNLPPTATPVRLDYGHFARLVGYQLSPETPEPGELLAITLYWQGLQTMQFDFHQSIKLLMPSGGVVAEIDQLPPLPTTEWWPGSIVTSTVRLLPGGDLSPPTALTLDVGLTHLETLQMLPAFNSSGQEIPRHVATIQMPVESQPDLTGVQPVKALFDGSLRLIGFRLPQPIANPGDVLTVDLVWTAQTPVREDFTIFLHVVDDSGTVVTQNDSQPVKGRYPTSMWDVGEVVIDTHQVPIGSNVSSGQYRLVTGLYRPADGQRLVAAIASTSTDSVELAILEIK
jgi:hypothetical protein